MLVKEPFFLCCTAPIPAPVYSPMPDPAPTPIGYTKHLKQSYRAVCGG